MASCRRVCQLELFRLKISRDNECKGIFGPPGDYQHVALVTGMLLVVFFGATHIFASLPVPDSFALDRPIAGTRAVCVSWESVTNREGPPQLEAKEQECHPMQRF